MRSPVLLAWLTTAVLITAPVAHADIDPDALWKVVHGMCVPDQEQHADPAPCGLVALAGGEDKGYAVLKDLLGQTQFLLIPTARIPGIESPAILAPDATNYFAVAWDARTFLEQRAGRPLPRDWVSLAINSVGGRSQNQLHIHIDCIRADVHAALTQNPAQTAWAPFPVPLAGHPYTAIAVRGGDLGVNPFTLLAATDPDMANETLVVVGAVGADGQPGFVILADHADAATGDRASGEELQDHNCALLHNSP